MTNENKIPSILLVVCFFQLLLAACSPDDAYVTPGNKKGPTVSSIIRFMPNTVNNNVADSISPLYVNVQITPEAALSKRVITLSTSLGFFSNKDTVINLVADAEGKLTAPLISNQPGIALIRAKASGIAIDTIFKFEVSYPDEITLEADKYNVDTSDTATLTARLFKNKGVCSDPIKVFFTVKPDSVSRNPLIITPFGYSANKKIEAKLANPFHVQGWFSITSATTNQNGDTIKSSIRLKIN